MEGRIFGKRAVYLDGRGWLVSHRCRSCAVEFQRMLAAGDQESCGEECARRLEAARRPAPARFQALRRIAS